MNKHKPTCEHLRGGTFCSCDLPDPPCPACGGTWRATPRATTPTEADFRPGGPYLGIVTPTPVVDMASPEGSKTVKYHPDPTIDPMNALHEQYCDEQTANPTGESFQQYKVLRDAALRELGLIDAARPQEASE